MPNVQMPDGAVVAFPDGMSAAQINAAIEADPRYGNGPAAGAAVAQRMRG